MSNAQQCLAGRRIKALEAYREMLQSNTEPIDLFKAALLIAKHKYPLLVSSLLNPCWHFDCHLLPPSLPPRPPSPPGPLAHLPLLSFILRPSISMALVHFHALLLQLFAPHGTVVF